MVSQENKASIKTILYLLETVKMLEKMYKYSKDLPKRQDKMVALLANRLNIGSFFFRILDFVFLKLLKIA